MTSDNFVAYLSLHVEFIFGVVSTRLTKNIFKKLNFHYYWSAWCFFRETRTYFALKTFFPIEMTILVI